MVKFFLNKSDQWIFEFLKNNVDIMPKRFVQFIANYYTDARIRKMYWEILGVEMGENTYPNLGFKSIINGENLVVIGKNVSIAPNVVMIPYSNANNGVLINELQYVNEKLTKKSRIIVEDDVWIGANTTIMPGVTIGTCSVIGAGSVVLEDVESYSVYAGVPARKIRDLN